MQRVVRAGIWICVILMAVTILAIVMEWQWWIEETGALFRPRFELSILGLFGPIWLGWWLRDFRDRIHDRKTDVRPNRSVGHGRTR